MVASDAIATAITSAVTHPVQKFSIMWIVVISFLHLFTFSCYIISAYLVWTLYIPYNSMKCQ